MKVTQFRKAPIICALLVITFILPSDLLAQEKKFTISGFSELRYTNRSGDPVDEELAEEFEDLGGDEELIEEGSRWSIPGFNTIITSTLSKQLTFQGEVVFSFEEEVFEVELLRSYLDYKLNPKFNLQAGKFLSPIGYFNRNQRFYGYLNYSVRPRDMVDKELGFIPAFTVGVMAYGGFDLSSTSTLNYKLSYGGMRGLFPEAGESISGIEFGEDESNSPGLASLLEYVSYIGESELTLGFSFYNVPRIVGFSVEDGDEVPYGEEADELEEDGLIDREEMELSEFGIAPYIRFDASKYQLMFEYHSTKFDDELGNLEQSSYDYDGYSVQLLYKTKLGGSSFYPYIRLDSRNLDEHPYYGLELEGGEELEKGIIPRSREWIVGAAWDAFPGNRIKAEYGRFLEGPFPQNEFRVSTSFGF